jgi:hypothetical protein
MKKSILLTLALFLSFSTFSFAQQYFGEETKNELKKQRGQVPAVDKANMQAKEMTLALDLTEGQQKDVEAILLEYHQGLEASMDSKNTDFANLSDEEKRAMKAKHLDAQIALKKEMKKILSKEQYEKFSTRMISGKRKMKQHKSGKGK